MNDPITLMWGVAEQSADALVDTLDALRRLHAPGTGDPAFDQLYREANAMSDRVGDWCVEPPAKDGSR